MEAGITAFTEIQLDGCIAFERDVGQDEAESVAVSVFWCEKESPLAQRAQSRFMRQSFAIEPRASSEKRDCLRTLGFKSQCNLVDCPDKKGRFIPALPIHAIGVAEACAFLDAANSTPENATANHDDRLTSWLNPVRIVGCGPMGPTPDGGYPDKVGAVLA